VNKIQTNLARSFREAEEFDAEFWRKAGVQARFSAAWLMVIEYFKMRGKGGNQPRLRRTVQNIKRI
jgi:hypothetical protein